jgi:hypothetical protein
MPNSAKVIDNRRPARISGIRERPASGNLCSNEHLYSHLPYMIFRYALPNFRKGLLTFII